MTPFIKRLIAHVRLPLFSNAYSLVLNSAVTSGLGVAYWIIAGRSYSSESVGLNSAIITVMVTLAKLASFNLTSALNRFLPLAGGKTYKIVSNSYLISIVSSVIFSLVFIFCIEIWSPTLGFLKSSQYSIMGIVFGTMVLCIFSLQDGVFIGLKRAIWVPIENLIFSVIKIVLLVFFATTLPAFGISASWVLSVALLTIPVNYLLFFKLIPRHVEKTEVKAQSVPLSGIVKFAASDYLASLISISLTFLLPLIVIEKFGASVNAYYYVSWSIAYSLYLVSENMGMSVIAEASSDLTKLNIYSFQIFIQALWIVVPVVTVLALGAPYILLLFGQEYASEGAILLRLLSLSAIPNIVTAIYLSILRVQRRMKILIFVLASLNILVLTLSFSLFGKYGINAIGISWLLSQTVVATLIIFFHLRKTWLPFLNTHALMIPFMFFVDIPAGWVNTIKKRTLSLCCRIF